MGDRYFQLDRFFGKRHQCYYYCLLLATSDVQNVTMCLLEASTYSIQCHYLIGSTALGCYYIFTSVREGVEHINGTIGRNAIAGVNLGFSRRSYDDILYVYDWKDNGSFGRLPFALAVSDTGYCSGTVNLCDTPHPLVHTYVLLLNHWSF